FSKPVDDTCELRNHIRVWRNEKLEEADCSKQTKFNGMGNKDVFRMSYNLKFISKQNPLMLPIWPLQVSVDLTRRLPTKMDGKILKNGRFFSQEDLLVHDQQKIMEEKLLQAECKCDVPLQATMKIAQEEKSKINKIAFTNTPNAQNTHPDARKGESLRIHSGKSRRWRRTIDSTQQETMEEPNTDLNCDDRIQRHLETLKRKAAELNREQHANTGYVPTLDPYERKKQSFLCNVLISEVYRLALFRGKIPVSYEKKITASKDLNSEMGKWS
ncbi:S phase cyclin A-associated protein in the endoplasmic reticulum, partial [Galemys pyrenaicus]